MKKIVLICLFAFVITLSVSGQQTNAPAPAPVTNIQGLRMEFITKELKLTTDEAAFWPLFYDYSDELRKARAEQTDDIIANEERILAIRKKYRTEFKKVLLTDERVKKVFFVDRDFNNILKAELDKRAQQKKN
ncbi:MAG: hypothetical protein V4450_11560 [Bacteroidota bacterium]